MRNILIVLLPLISSCSLNYAKKEALWLEDMLYTTEGEEYECEILKIINDSVYVITEEGRLVFSRKDIKSVDIAKKREGYTWKTVSDITDTLLTKALSIDLSKYHEMGYVNIWTEKKLIIQEDLSYTYSVRIIRGVTSEKGRRAGTLSFNYRSEQEEMEINFARTITDDGKVLHLSAIALEDASIYSRIPPYENLHERKFAMREVKPGNILDFKVTTKGRITKESPYVLDITLGNPGPTIEGIIEVVAPKNLELACESWRIGSPDIKRDNSKKILQWKVSDLPALIRESARPPLAYILPRVVVGLPQNWESLAEQFRHYLKGDYEVTVKKPEDIYGEVISSIRFVDVPSFVSFPYPKNAKEIADNRLANSLDKAHLLYQAFRSSGYPVEIILVRSKERGVVAKGVPSLYQFDGALLKVGNDYLDPSSELTPYGYVRPKYQGTKGLSIMKKSLVDIPLFEPDKEKIVFDRDIRLDRDGNAIVKETVKFTGNHILDLRQLRYLREERIKNIMESFINKTIPDAKLISYSIEHLNDITQEIIFNLKYSVSSLGLKEKDFILLHIPGLEYSAYSVGAPTRNYPIYWGHLSKEEKKIIIHLPDGYKVRHIPPGISYSIESLEYNGTLRSLKNRIVYKDTYIDKKEMISVEEYPEYKEALMGIAMLPEGWIILEKIE